MRYRFGRVELRTQSRELLVNGVVTPLGGRAFDLLQVLIERRERVVSAREIFALVWPGLAVQPNNLQVQVWTLRGLLGFGTIATVARRGYRFTAQIDAVLEEDPPEGHGRSVHADLPARRGANDWSIETAAVCAELGSHRMVTLAGPDDASRRGLAVAVARHMAGHLRGGTWFVDAPALAQAADDRPMDELQRFMRRLSVRDTLVVLFDAHHTVDAVRRLVEGTPLPVKVQLLATARGPLGLPGERVMPTPRRLATGAPAPAPRQPAGLRWQAR